jgi:general secretion pathway protein M
MQLLESTVQRWQQLQPRERRLVGVGSAILAVVLAYLFAFEPAWQGRQRLAAELPGLRAQLAQMEAMAAEARQLSGTAGTRDTPEQVVAQVEQSLAAAGLRQSVSQLSHTERMIDLRFEPVAFPRWLGWFDTALRETRLRVVDVAIERAPVAGQVSARLTLEIPGDRP